MKRTKAVAGATLFAQRLINEATSKLSTAVKMGNMQTAKVVQVMLDSGNDKLSEAMKQLAKSKHAKRSYKAS